MFGQKLGKNRTYTFKIDEPPLTLNESPVLWSSFKKFNVLDPYLKSASPVTSMNYTEIEADIYEVNHKDWQAFLRSVKYSDGTEAIGKHVGIETITIDAKLGQEYQHSIPLKKYFNSEGFGNLVVVINPTKRLEGVEKSKYREKIGMWIQSTSIGLEEIADVEETIVVASDLKSGAPISNAEVMIKSEQFIGIGNEKKKNTKYFTDKEGNVSFPTGLSDFRMVRVVKGKDEAFIPYYFAGRSQYLRQLDDEYRWYVFDDREIYRPSEKVSVKGWVRYLEHKKGGSLKLPSDAKKVKYSVVVYENTKRRTMRQDGKSQKIYTGESKIDEWGGFHLQFNLPKEVMLGRDNKNAAC